MATRWMVPAPTSCTLTNSDLPPVSAFWSLTMYDEHGFQAANELNRYGIGDRDPLQYNPDRSFDLYIGHIHPGRAREANWLPAPVGPLGITMRLYAPGAAGLTGAWSPLPLRKAWRKPRKSAIPA
jgi:hypothetical protein